MRERYFQPHRDFHFEDVATGQLFESVSLTQDTAVSCLQFYAVYGFDMENRRLGIARFVVSPLDSLWAIHLYAVFFHGDGVGVMCA